MINSMLNWKQRTIILAIISLIFLLGWFANFAYSSYSLSLTQSPIAVSKERISPSDHVKESQIQVYKDRIVIDIQDAVYAKYTDTNSMDPLFDKGANGIEIKINDPEQLHIGDIIAYKPSWTSGIIIHRIIDINEDEQGIYFITKGDNNPAADPDKIRFSQVDYLLIGIIY